MKELEFKDLVKKSEKLAKISDLWYFVNTRCASIMGRGNG